MWLWMNGWRCHSTSSKWNKFFFFLSRSSVSPYFVFFWARQCVCTSSVITSHKQPKQKQKYYFHNNHTLAVAKPERNRIARVNRKKRREKTAEMKLLHMGHGPHTWRYDDDDDDGDSCGRANNTITWLPPVQNFSICKTNTISQDDHRPQWRLFLENMIAFVRFYNVSWSFATVNIIES